MNQPSLTVVVPTRNGGSALRALIAALEAQTVPRRRFEVVIGDDGSTDGSTHGLATEDGWVRVSPGPPLNSYAARNRAARLARAPALAFCDADCRPDPTWVEAGLAALRRAHVAGGMVRFLLPKERTVWTLLTLDVFLDQETQLARGRGLGGNLFISRALFERLGGFDESLPSGGDGDLVSRAVEAGARTVFAPDAVVWHPTHDCARPFLRRIWFQNLWRSVRLARAGLRPYGLRLRWWIPAISKIRERRRGRRPLLLDRRRLATAGVVPGRWDDLKALPIIYLVIPYAAAIAQLWGWCRSRGSLPRAASSDGPQADEAPEWTGARQRAGGARMAVFPRWLDNPYLGLLSRELTERGFHVSFGERFDLRWLWRARRRVDVIHFHWPEGYYVCGRLGKAARLLSWITVALFGARLVVARVFGCRIVWTIHQLYPHDPGRKLLHTVAAGLLARASGLLLVHDRATAEVARRKLGRSVEGKLKVIPHGSYVGVYPPGRPRQAVRDELGIPADAFVFLAFGSVRRYKGLNLLLESFAALPGGNSFLLVAGEPKDERVAAEVGAAARKDSRIRPFLQFVPDERVAELFEASDVAVLPRSDGGTSGALILSLSMGLPAIAARKPAYQELIGDDEAGWLYREGDPASLRSRLAAAAGDRSALLAKGAAARGVVERLSWSEIGGRTAEAILALGDRERRRGGRPRAAERLVRDG